VLRISRETDYAIRVLLALAKLPRDEIVPSAVIRMEMRLPESLSLQIISRLANLKFINTYPGRNGGIQLAHPPEDISLLAVIQALEGPILLSDCLGDEHPCQLAPDCTVQDFWIQLQGKIESELQAVNFENLAAKKQQNLVEDVQ
jgi:Rrf2 family protein